MVLKVIFLVWVLFMIGWFIIRGNYKNRVSFKEALDLTELPIITFYQNDKKLNFLLDTGSNQSHISESMSKVINGNIESVNNSICGIGETSSSLICNTVLNYRSSNYSIGLYITKALDSTFSTIKKQTGVQLHGILGNDFFQKYRYILDFESLTAYHR